jgi:hypothetical protein
MISNYYSLVRVHEFTPPTRALAMNRNLAVMTPPPHPPTPPVRTCIVLAHRLRKPPIYVLYRTHSTFVKKTAGATIDATPRRQVQGEYQEEGQRPHREGGGAH